MTLDEFERELNQRLFRSVYLLLGPEDFLRRRVLQELKEKALPTESSEFNFTEFSARSASLRHILVAANTFPMMSPRRLVFVGDLESLKEADQEELVSYLRKPFERTLLVLTAHELDKRTTFYKSLKEHACVIELTKLKGYSLERWAEERIRDQGYRISSAAIKKLIDLAGSDLQTLSNEIEKLLLYCGTQKVIADSFVDLLVRGSRLHGIFELTGSLGRKDKRAALRLLGDLIESGEPSLMIVNMLARHFRQVLIVKELLNQGRAPAEIGSVAQIPSFILGDFIRQARATDMQKAANMYLCFAEADRRFKSTGVDERMFLEKIICAF